MASYMSRVVVEEIKNLIRAASFVAITVDEVTSVDNGSYLSVHCYTVNDWVRVPHMISLGRVDCAPNARNLTKLIIEAIKNGGGLDREMIASKLLSFGADGASALQGWRSGATVQITEEHAPFCIGVHCIAHRYNLAFKALSTQPIFGTVEQVLSQIYSYFCKSPKRFSEFRQLAELTQTKRLKMLQKVETRWVSLIEPLRRLLSEYRTLIYKMTEDMVDNDKAEVCNLPILNRKCLLTFMQSNDVKL